ncbi:DUF1254 domain-containing protein [Falsiroseomonas sp. E2-1-a20]|uniref:DUF1254 domain-containing protein n=1 Tax=Falsiroseomonas sp. E2-1-a20 TaxID=3239300 RepID=UPI003F36175C
MLPRRHAPALPLATALPLVTPARARAAEMAQDEELAHAIGVRVYIWASPMMDLYRTRWETSVDPTRGHDRRVNEFFRFERLINHEDDRVITPNNDTIYDRAFMDLRSEPMILSIPAPDRNYWFPVGDMRHDFSARLSWDMRNLRGSWWISTRVSRSCRGRSCVPRSPRPTPTRPCRVRWSRNSHARRAIRATFIGTRLNLSHGAMWR